MSRGIAKTQVPCMTIQLQHANINTNQDTHTVVIEHEGPTGVRSRVSYRATEKWDPRSPNLLNPAILLFNFMTH